MISHKRLTDLLSYNPITGIFRWKVEHTTNARLGAVAGGTDHYGYWRIGVDDTRYAAHRLAWFHFYGAWPSGELDHINRVKHFNAISNLREATRSENARNRALQSNNTSGILGVTWNKTSRKWQAQIKTHGKLSYLGVYVDKQDAIEARRKAEALR